MQDAIKIPYMGTILTQMGFFMSSQHARIQSHAAAACVNVFDNLDEEGVIAAMPYLDNIMSKIYELYNHPKLYVQSQAVTTTSFVAEAIGNRFTKVRYILCDLSYFLADACNSIISLSLTPWSES